MVRIKTLKPGSVVTAQKKKVVGVFDSPEVLASAEGLKSAKKGCEFFRIGEKVMEFNGFGVEKAPPKRSSATRKKVSPVTRKKTSKAAEKKSCKKRNCDKPSRRRGLCFAHLRKFKESREAM